MNNNEINNTGKHAELDIEIHQHEGIDIKVIKKSFVIHFDLNPEEIKDLYIKHREELSSAYRIPTLRAIEVKGNQLVVIEDMIIGENGLSVLEGDQSDQIRQFTRVVFQPLLSRAKSIQTPILHHEMNEFPIDLMYDIKPDNFVLRNNEIYAVDFYPPRLRTQSGLLQPYHISLDQGDRVYITYLYGDLVPLATRFLFESFRVSESAGLQVAQELRILLNSNMLLYNRFIENLRKPRVLNALRSMGIEKCIYEIFIYEK